MADVFSGFRPPSPEQDKYKDSFLDDLKASAILSINGAFNAMDDKYNVPVNDIEEGFSHTSADTQELYKSYGVLPQDQMHFYDARGTSNLVPRLERYKARREASERLAENQPMMQYPMLIGTSLVDPVGWALAPFGYKVAGSVNALRNASRMNNAIKLASAGTTAAVGSEYMLQASADSINYDELGTVAGYSALFSAGIGALLPVGRGVNVEAIHKDMMTPPTETEIVARQEAIFGVNDFDHIKEGFDGKIEGLKAKFIWSPIGQMMKSNNPVTRAIGNVLEKSPVALTNGQDIVTSATKTAMNTKGDLSGYHLNFVKGLEEGFKVAKSRNPNLTRAEYSKDIGKKYRQWLRDVEEEAMLRYNELPREDFDINVLEDIKKQVADELPPSPELKGVQDYFHKIQQFGEAVEHSSLKGKSGKTYMNRVFDKDAIEKMGEPTAVAKLVESMKANPITRREIQNLLSEGRTQADISAELEKYATDVIRKIRKSNVYEEMDFRRVNEMATPSPLKGRHLQIDEVVADDLLVNDIGQITEYYNYKTAGKLALKKHLGVENAEDLQKISDSISEKGFELGMSKEEIAKDLDMFNAMIDSINGTREIAKKPNTWGQKATRLFTKFNYVTLGGTFGLNTVGELGSVVSTNGLKVFKYMVPAMRETLNMYKGHPTKETTNELLALGIGEQIYRSNRAMRYDAIDTMNTTGKFESLLDKGSNMMSNASGLNFMTTTLELMAGASTLEDLMRMAAKGTLSRAEQKRLARLGLTVEDIKGIAKHSKAEYKDGYLMAYNFDDWTDQTLVDKIRDGISEVVKNAVIQADPTTIPVWATNPDNPLLRLATQFMRFPLAAHERLLVKGLDEMSARQATGFLATTGLMASIYALREEALIQAGAIDELDRKYDWETEEGLQNLGKATFNKIGHLGLAPTAFDYMNKALNPDADTYGTDTTTTFLGTLGRANDALGVIKDVQDGRISDKTIRTIKYFTPYYTLPYVKEGVDALTKD